MTQHIEDKLAALAEKATQGEWKCRQDGNLEMAHAVIGGGWKYSHDMRHIAALHNAAPALLAVVRAARALNGAHDPSHRVVCSMQLASAISALDAVEV